MFSLIDVLASREEAISLKEISEKIRACTRLPPTASSTTWPPAGSSTAQRRAATGWACACWNWATLSKAG
jgi:hypothetical protein